MHIIKSHSWVTASLANFDKSPVVQASIDNFVQFRNMPQNIYAIQPNYFETAESYFLSDFGSDFEADSNLLEPYLGHQYGSGLDFGE